LGVSVLETGGSPRQPGDCYVFVKAGASGGALSIIPGRTAGCPGAVVVLPCHGKRAVARFGVAAVTIGCLALVASCAWWSWRTGSRPDFAPGLPR